MQSDSFVYNTFRVSLLQPTSPKFQDFAEQVRERAASDYNYTFSDHEEVSVLIDLGRKDVEIVEVD